MKQFSQKAIDLLNSYSSKKYYVYRLIDPRTHYTFYVGKGCGNRVFDHVNNANKLITSSEDAMSLKVKLISEIIAAGKEVICVIHRWGLSEKTAYEVEAALIDCYPGLTNIQNGHHENRGVISIEDLESSVNKKPYVEPKEDYVIIKTSENAIVANGNLYEATRRYWKANIKRAVRYKYVVSVIHGIVQEVYEVNKWYTFSNRIAFEGQPTNNVDLCRLKGLLIPQCYREKGNAQPFLYKK